MKKNRRTNLFIACVIMISSAFIKAADQSTSIAYRQIILALDPSTPVLSLPPIVPQVQHSIPKSIDNVTVEVGTAVTKSDDMTITGIAAGIMTHRYFFG